MRRLFLVRHGQTEWNATGRLQGSADIPLDATGRSQAQTAAHALATRVHTPATVIASPLERARDTATVIARTLGVTPTEDPRLAERSFGIWEGTTEAERESDNAVELERWRGGAEPRIAGYETQSVLVARMRAAVDHHVASSDGDLVVVSHGSAIRAVMSDLLGVPAEPTQARSLIAGLDNAHWALLSGTDREWSLLEHNVGAGTS